MEAEPGRSLWIRLIAGRPVSLHDRDDSVLSSHVRVRPLRKLATPPAGEHAKRSDRDDLVGTYEARRQRLRCDSPPRPQRHLDTFDLEAVRVGRGTRAVRSRVAAAGAQAECDQAENERVPRAHVCLLPVRGLTLIRTLGPIWSHHRIVVARKPDAGDLRSVRRGTTRRVPARGCCARAACHRLWRSGEQSSTSTDQVASNNLRAIRIGDQRALLASSHLHLSPGARLDGKQFATLLWPATKRTLQGRYGLSGPFSAQRLLSFARSMERARASAPGGRRPGC